MVDGAKQKYNLRFELRYLFIVLQLIVKDEAVGLVRLGPGQGYAVRCPGDLVHDGHSGWCWGWETIKTV